MIGIFENYSTTRDDPKSKIQPLVSPRPAHQCFALIKTYLDNEGYEDIMAKEDFLEIYCTDYGFEITVSIIGSGATSSLVNVAVFGEKKRGKTRGKLKKLIAEITPIIK